MKCKYSILLSLLAICVHLQAARSPREDAHIRAIDNFRLSSSAVNEIFQDSEGLLWIGTWDGLNRFDGSSVRRYNRVLGDSTSLSHQVIREIAARDQNNLWITTDYGINLFDKATGKSHRYFADYTPYTNYREHSLSLAISPDGTTLASLHGGGLFVYDEQGRVFQPMRKRPSLDYTNIYTMFFDRLGYLWMVNERNGLVKLKLNDDKTLTVLDETKLPGFSRSKVVYDGEDALWYAGEGRLHRIRIATKELEVFDTGVPVEGNLKAVCRDGDIMLVGTSTGLYELSGHEIRRIPDIDASVLSLYRGSQDIVWIGTDGQGVYQRYHRPDFITGVQGGIFSRNGSYPVRAIIYDSKGRMWIGSKGGGLARIDNPLDPENSPRRTYDVGYGRSYNSTLSLALDEDRVWIGTDGDGIKYYDPAEGDEIHELSIPSVDLVRPIESIYDMVVDGNTLYVATSGNGLFVLTLSDDHHVLGVRNIVHSATSPDTPGSDIIYALANDGSHLWIGTRGGGLSVMDKKTGRMRSYHADDNDSTALISDDVISLLRDNRGRIWVGTSQGISVAEEPFSASNSRSGGMAFRNLDTRHGLPNANIHAIAEDSNHDIWVSTSQGLSKIDGKNYSVTSFYREDGLRNDEYADGAGFVAPDGRMLWFGGINGLDAVRPHLYVPRDYMPRLLLTGVNVGSRPYVVADNTIRASYSDNTIEMTFAVTDFLDNKQCRISYKIVPRGILSLFSKETDWIDLRDTRTILLSQLPSGSYKLLVRVANASHQWGEPEEYTIYIKSPVWATWWAILLYIIIVAGVVYGVYRNKRTRLQMAHALDLEKHEKERKEELHQAKLRFFTNIAHEFSNSITLIYGAAEQLMGAKSDRRHSQKQLTAIKRNAERMRNQIQELMEFRKVETGYVREHPEFVDVPALVGVTVDNFAHGAEAKEIDLRIDVADDPALSEWVVDREMLEKIIFNLLSNSVKYTPAGGFISLTVLKVADNDNLRIVCRNNGPGIPPEKIKDIFNRFMVLDNFERGLSEGHYSHTGIGLALCRDLAKLMGGTIRVESVPGEVTTFTVELPRRNPEEAADRELPRELEPVDLPKPDSVPEATRMFEREKPVVLVIDDMRDIRELISDVLGEDYCVKTAVDGQDGMKKVEECAPDLVICDIIMPRMNGMEFIRTIKGDQHTRHIPVIMLSSKSSIENSIEMLESGANMFVGKPFHPEYLKAAVDNILRNRVIMREFSESAEAYSERFNSAIVTRDDKLFIDKVIEVLSQNYAMEEYDADALAEDLAMSRTQLYRRIKRVAQTTPAEFIRSYRLDQAARMLRNTDLTIQEVLIKSGFHNKAHFYRLFQRVYGMSPRYYRSRANQPEE